MKAKPHTYLIQVLYRGNWRTVQYTKDHDEAERLRDFYKSINDTQFVRIVKE